MISYEDLYALLGFERPQPLHAEDMAQGLSVTFYPTDHQEFSERVGQFRDRLEETFARLGVTIVPYEDAMHTIPLRKRLKRAGKILASDALYAIKKVTKRKQEYPYMGRKVLSNALKPHKIRPGIAVIVTGTSESGHLAMDNTSSFRGTSIVTILDLPDHISEKASFDDHFKTSIELFAHHMTNVVIAVGKTQWFLYNFNASHPHFSLKEDLEDPVLHALIPKLAAPMLPPKTEEFTLAEHGFDAEDEYHTAAVQELTQSGPSFEQTNIFPKGRKIDDLPFRNQFYR
jgi:hypothetical protein